MKKLWFIYNPYSGKGQIKNALYDILQIIQNGGYEAVLHPTACQGDALEQIKNRGNEFDRIVVSGGDGTLDEAVAGMIEGNIEVPLGYIPGGTTCDFASSIGIPKRMRKAAEVAVNGVEFPCDICTMNGHPFVYVAAFGTLTDISYDTSQELKSILGHGAYIFEGFKRYKGLDRIRIKVDSEEVHLDEDFCYGMVSNSKYVAGVRMNFAKNVSLDDGMFEVILIKKPDSPLQFSGAVAEMIIPVTNDYMVIKFKSSKVTFDFKYATNWTRDGENGGRHNKVVIEMLKQRIKFMVPAK